MSTYSSKYDGNTEIPCKEHDYEKFPGLKNDLDNYARNWKGAGWDDIKVNVKDAEGTSIYVGQPTVTPIGQPDHEDITVVEDTLRNNSSVPIETSVTLKGSTTNSLSATVESELSSEIASEIGGDIMIFSASLSTKLSATQRRGETETSSTTMEHSMDVKVSLKPKQAVRVQMVATTVKNRMRVTLPCSIKGPFRIQYPSRVDGHYYWIGYILNAAHDNHNEEDMVIIVNDGITIKVKARITDVE